MTAAVILLSIFFVTALGCLYLVWLELRYAAKLIAWETARDLLVLKVWEEAKVVTAVPDHTDIVEGPGGNLMMKEPVGGGMLLNYASLKGMVKIMQEQERDRRVYTGRLKASLDDVSLYESMNPPPQPTRIFGHRIPIP